MSGSGWGLFSRSPGVFEIGSTSHFQKRMCFVYVVLTLSTVIKVYTFRVYFNTLYNSFSFCTGFLTVFYSEVFVVFLCIHIFYGLFPKL